MPPANTPRNPNQSPLPDANRKDKQGATPPTDTPATTKTPDPIEAPGTQGVKSETDRSKAYGPGGGSPIGLDTTSEVDAASRTPGRDAASNTNTADIDNPATTARPGQTDETGSRTSGEAL